MTLGYERRLQSLGAVMVAMVDGASVFGRIIDDMPMDDWPTRVRLVQVLGRQYRQSQRCSDCTDRYDDSGGSSFQHEP